MSREIQPQEASGFCDFIKRLVFSILIGMHGTLLSLLQLSS